MKILMTSKKCYKSTNRTICPSIQFGPTSTTWMISKTSPSISRTSPSIGYRNWHRGFAIFPLWTQALKFVKISHTPKAKKGMFSSRMLTAASFEVKFGRESLPSLISSTPMRHSIGRTCSKYCTQKSSSRVFGST